MNDMPPSVSFGEHLRRYRERAGLTQEQLAAHAGVSAKAISALERNTRRQPYLQTVQALATALGLSKDEYATFLDARSHRASDPSRPSFPIRSPSPVPVSLTPLIGRDADVTMVEQLLGRHEVRLLTLTGPGGVGKTRLALHVTAQSADWFADSVAFVALAPIADPALVVPTIVRTLGLQEVGGQAPWDTLCVYLEHKHILLVLDNVEHLLAAVPQLAQLLMCCARLKMLVTSRAPLQVRGEQEYLVEPLALPPMQPVPVMEEVASVAAVQLFVERAQQVVPAFGLTPANAAAIAAICRRLDGLPLALELAAARVKVLTPTALLARLDHALPLLTGGARDLPARQQTIRRTLDWSYDLLAPNEQRVFRTLAAFAGGWTLEAAEAVAQGMGEPLILDVLANLVSKSLVVAETDDALSRYRLLEPVRQYAQELLAASADVEDIKQRHATFFLGWGEQAQAHVRGPRQAEWLHRLDQELPNVLVALSWWLTRSDAAGALRLSSALWHYWARRGSLREGRWWLGRALAQPSADLAARAWGLHAASWLAVIAGDTAGARVLVEEGVAAFRALGNATGVGRMLNLEGWLMLQQGRYAEAQRLNVHSLALLRQEQDHEGLAEVLKTLADVALTCGDVTHAVRYYEESLTYWRAIGDQSGVARTLSDLARLAGQQGAYTRADALLDESTHVFRALGMQRSVAINELDRGLLALQHGTIDRAEAVLREQVLSLVEWGNTVYVGFCLVGLAVVAGHHQQPERTARLLGAAERLLVRNGEALGPVDQHLWDRAVAAKAHLSEERWTAAWTNGQQLSLEQAVAYAVAPA